jgi:hypothetical protein
MLDNDVCSNATRCFVAVHREATSQGSLFRENKAGLSSQKLRLAVSASPAKENMNVWRESCHSGQGLSSDPRRKTSPVLQFFRKNYFIRFKLPSPQRRSPTKSVCHASKDRLCQPRIIFSSFC